MLTLVLGGARSGKSRYARSLFPDERVLFVATASETDPEMSARIERHRAERPPHWTTIEAPLDVPGAILGAPEGAAVLVDCLTLWISNLMYEYRRLERDARERRILDEVMVLDDASRARNVVVVSNEVGQGVVPENPVAREFRDLQGRANQTLAASASRVILVVAGIPLNVKG